MVKVYEDRPAEEYTLRLVQTDANARVDIVDAAGDVVQTAVHSDARPVWDAIHDAINKVTGDDE